MKKHFGALLFGGFAMIGLVFAALPTSWYDRDNPSGVGDYELFVSPCPNSGQLVAVEVKKVPATSDSLLYSGAIYNGMFLGKYIHVYGPSYAGTNQRGMYCANAENSGSCIDFQVRFRCEAYSSGTQIGNCTGLAANAVWNTVSSITQYYVSGLWMPSLIGVYNTTPSTTECRFTCLSGYVWSGNACLRANPGTQIGNCTGLAANAVWNTVSSITQYYVSGLWMPSLIGVYNTTPSTTECRFTCLSGYVWSGNACFSPFFLKISNPIISIKENK